MPFHRISDDYFNRDAILAASVEANLLHLRCRHHCSYWSTDGHVRAEAVAALAASVKIRHVQATIDELVSLRLWQRTTSGYYLTDFLLDNPSEDQVAQRRAKGADRVRDYRERVKAATGPGPDPGDADVTPLHRRYTSVSNAPPITDTETETMTMSTDGSIEPSNDRQTHPSDRENGGHGLALAADVVLVPQARAAQRGLPRVPTPAHATLADFVPQLRLELGDRASAKATMTRLLNLYDRSGLAEDDFWPLIYAARATTKANLAQIRATGGNKRKAAMPYFFAVLTNYALRGMPVEPAPEPDTPELPEAPDETPPASGYRGWAPTYPAAAAGGT